MRRYRNAKGVVTLEFVFVFPFVVAIVYGAAAYGVLFFDKYRMQVAVDNAAASVFTLDRRGFPAFSAGAVAHSVSVLEALVNQLPDDLAARIPDPSCASKTVSGLELLECELVADGSELPFLPQVSFGFLGRFPPLPESLKVSSVVAF